MFIIEKCSTSTRVFGTSLDAMFPARVEVGRGITIMGSTSTHRQELLGHRGQWQRLVAYSTRPYGQVWADYDRIDNKKIENAYVDMKESIVIQTLIGGDDEERYSAVRIVLNEPFYEYILGGTGERHEVRRVWVKDKDRLDDSRPWVVSQAPTSAASSSSGQ